jgi:ornithine cyclodeaminase/alanine dehydrogenase-like protein (mu-crystallin family)
MEEITIFGRGKQSKHFLRRCSCEAPLHDVSIHSEKERDRVQYSIKRQSRKEKKKRKEKKNMRKKTKVRRKNTTELGLCISQTDRDTAL